MSFAFVCAQQEDTWDDPHQTVIVMKFCPRCGRSAVAGYQCETCEYEDTDPVDELVGHGEGKCQKAGEQS